jgi:hypothetical protein
MTPGPLDLSENDILTLLQNPIEFDILTSELGQRRGTWSEATSTERLRFRRASIVQLKPEMLQKLGKLSFCKLV